MENATPLDSEPQTDGEHEAAFEQLLADIRHIGEPKQRDRGDAEPRRTEADIQEQIDALRQEVRALSHAVQHLQDEQRHACKMAALDSKSLALRVENALLRFERRLPPTKQNDGQ